MIGTADSRPRADGSPGLGDSFGERERLLDRVLQLIPAGVLVRDVEGRLVRSNPAAERMLGRSAEELKAIDFWAITHPDDVAADTASREALLRGERESAERLKRYRHRDGYYIWVRLSASVLRGDDQQVLGTIAVIEDVTHERQVEEGQRARESALVRAKALFETTMQNIRDGVVLLDSERRVLLANRAYAELLCFDESELVGTSRDEFLAHVEKLVEHPSSLSERLERTPAAAGGESDEFVLVRPRRRVLRRTTRPIDLPDGAGHLVIWQDVTVERELSLAREREALTDPLTGIPNRRAAEQVLKKELARVKRAGSALSIAFFDVDHFKRVNDAHGHGAGDEVLRLVAATLERATRLTDSVARWGGEEFLAVLPVGLQGAVTFCERVRAAVEDLACPGVGHVTISAGVAELDPNEELDTALAQADARLYAAKAAGRNRVCS